MLESKGKGEEETWSKIVGRKARIGIRQEKRNEQGGPGNGVKGKAGIGTNTRRGKELATAAIIINCAPEKGEEVMKEARRKINLQEIGIMEGMKCRRAITGAILFEIEGKEKEEKARILEGKLRETFLGREEVKVYRLVKTTEIKIMNMEESPTSGQIVEAVVKMGGCNFTEVRIGRLKINGNELATAWVRCPVTAANRIMEKGGMRIGWVKAKTTVLRARPLQCFRSMQVTSDSTVEEKKTMVIDFTAAEIEGIERQNVKRERRDATYARRGGKTVRIEWEDPHVTRRERRDGDHLRKV